MEKRSSKHLTDENIESSKYIIESNDNHNKISCAIYIYGGSTVLIDTNPNTID